jgi:hypothetical protein
MSRMLRRSTANTGYLGSPDVYSPHAHIDGVLENTDFVMELDARLIGYNYSYLSSRGCAAEIFEA